MPRHPSVSTEIELDGRELDTVLMALRLYEYLLTAQPELCERVAWIARDKDDPVTADEVAELCERIN